MTGERAIVFNNGTRITPVKGSEVTVAYVRNAHTEDIILTFNTLGELKEAAEKGDLSAMADLGAYYLYSGEKDYLKAFVLLQDASIIGNADAMLHLGRMYENGWHVERDMWTAISLYRRAHIGKVTGARKAMGDAYDKLADEIEVTGRLVATDDFHVEACCTKLREGIRMGRIMPKEDDDGVRFYIVNFTRETPTDHCPYCGARQTV
ncbi:MAG: sel1 repeat family protein [Thermoplasmatales archaeon]|nr:sel1 repeat family protein [Thermoplasmatales archaeon]